MKYVLTTSILDIPNDIPLTPEQFEAAKNARNGLIALLGVEERFAFVIDDFRDFEIEMLNQAVDALLYSDRTWSSSVAQLQNLNRLLSNLLSICRLYLDQTAHDLSSLFDKASPVLATFTESRRREYESSAGYRVMEALRDYVQHRSAPIYRVTIEARYLSASSPREWGITPYLNLDQLRLDKKFKQSAIQEFVDQQETDIKPLVRGYIEGLSNVQLALRQAVATSLTAWDTTLEELFSSFERVHGPRGDLSLYALSLDEEEHVTDRLPLLRDFTARRRALADRLPGVHLARTHVSSAVWCPDA